MTKQPQNNNPASIRDRLLNLAREQKKDFQLILTQYGLERLLYRLSQSNYQDQFILKGAMLFFLWSKNSHRPTRDIDLLGYGDSDEGTLQIIFQDLCNIPVEDDGIIFDANTVLVETIRSKTEYGGTRIKLQGRLASARIAIQADIAFGDAVTPKAIEADFPTLLTNPAPRLMVYPIETVIAEKYHALVNLGMANSRLKDFYDLWTIALIFDFDGTVAADAIHNTFLRRQTPLPEKLPVGLSNEFYQDSHKINQWNAFLRRGKISTDSPSLKDACQLLELFLIPPTLALNNDLSFKSIWKAGGPWVSNTD